jgi:hypothetical protein
MSVVTAPNSNVRWLPPWFCMPARGKIVFSHLIFFPVTVERTAVAARHATPGTGQEGPLLGHGSTKRERPLPCPFLSLFLLLLLPLLETLAAGLASDPNRSRGSRRPGRVPRRRRLKWKQRTSGAQEEDPAGRGRLCLRAADAALDAASRDLMESLNGERPAGRTAGGRPRAHRAEVVEEKGGA